MVSENVKVFLIGIAGGVIGLILIIGMIFGFFSIMDKLNRAEIVCLPQKEVKKGEIICKILEIKDRGEILKVSEMVSLPTDERELQRIKDKTTTGKFVEIKIDIKNIGKENQNIGETILIDDKDRTYSKLGSCEFEYWIPPELQGGWNVGPGLEKEFSQIFEVPEDADNFRLKIKIYRFRID